MRLPDFIIGGERRCGTTSLYHALRGHPEIFLPPKTEVSYFVDDALIPLHSTGQPPDPAAWEATHTPADYAALFAEGEKAAAAGHKGADLLFWTPTHRRIARFVPDVRLVVILREPAERAWSQYWNEVGKGRETLGFEDALAAEKERSDRDPWAHYHLSYQARGFYARSLGRLFETFPRERVHVMVLEELRERPEATLRELHTFLGITPGVGLPKPGERRNENWTTVPRTWADSSAVRPVARLYSKAARKLVKPIVSSKEARRRLLARLESPFRRPASVVAMSAETRDRLQTSYAAEIAELEALLDRSFASWRPIAGSRG